MNEWDYPIMGTGSRSMVVAQDRADIYLVLETYLWARYTTNPAITLISGGAEGWDEAIAKVGLRRGIPYDMILPTVDYGSYYWGKNSLTRKNRLNSFNELLAGAREIVYCDQLYTKEWSARGPLLFIDGKWQHANMARNDVMVKRAKEAVIYDSKSPGTRDAVKKLKKIGLTHHVYPFIYQEKLF